MGIQANQYLGRGIQITSIHVADHRRSRIEHRSTKPTGIRTNTVHGRQGNAMIHNYWSHKHVADRLRGSGNLSGGPSHFLSVVTRGGRVGALEQMQRAFKVLKPSSWHGF
jgi:hypothetical protein